MIESIDNLIQLLITGICTGLALYRALATGRREWVLLGLFSAVFFLGDLYWGLFILFYEDSPQFTNISDLSWDTAYLFLMILIIYLRVESEKHDMHEEISDKGFFNYIVRMHTVQLLVPMFTIGMCMFFISRGEVLNNIIVAVMMTGLLWHAIGGILSSGRDKADYRRIYYITVIFCLSEYGMWLSSCFWMGDRITNIYFWFDFIVSVSFVLFVKAMDKVVSR